MLFSIEKDLQATQKNVTFVNVILNTIFLP